MIARIWHGAVPAAKKEDYLHRMRTVALPDYQSIAGNRGAFCLCRIEGDVAHFEMLTFWDGVEAMTPSAALRSPWRRSVLREWRPFLLNPLLHRWAAPLVSGVVDQSLRHRIAEHDQTLQHHGEIDVGDRPGAEEILGAAVEQAESR
jgi:hypothetical protein